MFDRSRILAVVVGMVFFARLPIAVAQQPNPDSPRYKAVVALSDFLTSTGDEALKLFVDDRISPTLLDSIGRDSLASALDELRSNFSGAQMAGARPEGPNGAFIRFSNDQSISFEFEADPPHRFVRIGSLRGEGSPSNDAARDATSQQTNAVASLEIPAGDPRPVAAIEKYLRQLADQGLLSGTVLIATEGHVWFEQAYGLASREFQVPDNVDTRFDVGSLSKAYLRLAILQLQQNGALAPSDTVGKYLPNYPNDRVRNEVTIEQLLTHRSGLGDMFTREYMETPMQSLRDIDDYIPIWGPKPLEYEPGTRQQYSNYGYTVLGAIIESITGMSYPEYVERHIFEPAGMHDTGFFEVDGIEPNVAVGYTYVDTKGRRSDTLRKNIYLEPVKGGPWGKSYSTARDVFRFYDALFAGDLIGDDLNWMPAGWNTGIGFAGGGPGLSAFLMLGDGVAVIVLANHDPGGENVARRLLEAMTAELTPSSKFSLGIQMGLMNGTVMIDEVFPGSAAERDGLKAGDRLLGVNGTPFGDDPLALLDPLLRSGATIRFEIERNGEHVEIEVKPNPR